MSSYFCDVGINNNDLPRHYLGVLRGDASRRSEGRTHRGSSDIALARKRRRRQRQADEGLSQPLRWSRQEQVLRTPRTFELPYTSQGVWGGTIAPESFLFSCICCASVNSSYSSPLSLIGYGVWVLGDSISPSIAVQQLLIHTLLSIYNLQFCSST